MQIYSFEMILKKTTTEIEYIEDVILTLLEDKRVLLNENMKQICEQKLKEENKYKILVDKYRKGYEELQIGIKCTDQYERKFNDLKEQIKSKKLLDISLNNKTKDLLKDK